jgi:phage antirepressor YoqD-like protein
MELVARTTEVQLMESKDARNTLIDRVEVLGKVKSLTMLPDDFHVTTQMAADYYEVPRSTIESIIEDHRDELTLDGYRVLTGEGLREFKGRTLKGSNLYNLYKFAPSLALLPRRAVLRIGMLLRDSEVAKRVRDYLLSNEELATTEHRQQAVTHNLPQNYLEALKELVRVEEERQLLLPKAEMFDAFMSAENVQSGREVAKSLGTGVKRLYGFLREKGVFMKNNVPYQRYIDSGHFVVSQVPVRNAHLTINTPVTRLTPKGIAFVHGLIQKEGGVDSLK